MMQLLQDMIHYFVAVLVDGDYANDWLSHIPYVFRYQVEAIGYVLSLVTQLWI